MVLTGRTCIAAWPTNVARHHIFTVTEGLFLPKGYRCTHIDIHQREERYTLGGGQCSFVSLHYTAVGK